MIMMHEYPLSMVDHIGFRDFANSLSLSFKMISQNTLKTNIMNVFYSEKIIVKEVLVDNCS